MTESQLFKREPDYQWQQSLRTDRPSIPSIGRPGTLPPVDDLCALVINRKSLWTGPASTSGSEPCPIKTEVPPPLSVQQERPIQQQQESRLTATPQALRSSRSSINARTSRLSLAPTHVRYSHSATTLRHPTDGPFSVEGLVQQGIKFHEAGQLEKAQNSFGKQQR